MVLKEDKEFAIIGKPKDSIREETSVVSDTMEINGENLPQNLLHVPFNQYQEVEARREK